MNEQKNSSDKPLLVLRVDRTLKAEQRERLAPSLERLASQLGAVVVIEEPGTSVSPQPNPQALLDSSLALTESVSRLVQAITLQTKTMQELIEAMYEGGDDEDEEDLYTTLDGR